MECSNLILEKPNLTSNAFEKRGALGLFRLFFTRSFTDTILCWTNNKFKQEGKQKNSKGEFDAYMGLELSMSLTHNNNIHEYWSEKPFLSVKGYGDVMGRDRFQQIRSGLQIRPEGLDKHSIKHDDPLWHSRSIFNGLLSNCMSTAVSTGVVTLNEASVRTKAKTRAKTYLPSKPDKCAICFYAINCWKSLYLQNFFGNGAGNKEDLTCSDRYVQSFPKLRTLFHNSVDTVLTDNTIEGMEKTKQTWLWSLQMSHISLQHESPYKKRLVVTDNYYTRPTLSRVVRQMTDGEIRTIGTLRLSCAGKQNRANLEFAIAKMKEQARGSLMLVADHALRPDFFQMRKKYDRENKNIPKAQRTPFVPPVGEIIKNAGFVVFMGKNPVIIHTNDLKHIITTTFMYSTEQLTIECVHALVPLRM